MSSLHFAINLAGAWLFIGAGMFVCGVLFIVCMDVIGLRRRYDALAIMLTMRDLIVPLAAAIVGLALARL